MSNEETLQENNERLETNNVALAEVLAIINELPDAEANGTGGTLDNFSTEEVKTNQVWIDGRPIYRKVLPTGQLQNNGSVRVKYNIQNLDIFTKVEGIAHGAQYGLLLPTASYVLNKNVNVYIDYVAGEIGIETASDRSMYTNGYLIVEYVKTTDDDVFVPDGGGSLEVYDETETLVGVWMGKALYRKVFNTGALPNAQQQTYNFSVPNIDKIVKTYGYSSNGANVIPLPYVSTTIAGCVTLLTYGKNEIIINSNGTDRRTYTETYVVLEYTKTTD